MCPLCYNQTTNSLISGLYPTFDSRIRPSVCIMSMARQPGGLELLELEQIPLEEPIYQGVDSEGRFLLPSNLSNKGAGADWGSGNPLTERYLVAMALTEVCCQIKRGKVNRALCGAAPFHSEGLTFT